MRLKYFALGFALFGIYLLGFGQLLNYFGLVSYLQDHQYNLFAVQVTRACLIVSVWLCAFWLRHWFVCLGSFVVTVFLAALVILTALLSDTLLEHQVWQSPFDDARIVWYVHEPFMSIDRDRQLLVYEKRGQASRMIYVSEKHQPVTLQWLSKSEILVNEEEPYHQINLKLSVKRFLDRDETVIGPKPNWESAFQQYLETYPELDRH